MQNQVAQRLLDINHQFYQTFSVQFSATRQRIQPGVRKVLAMLPPEGCLLDLGCGNGEFARELHHQGWRGQYVGVDFSAGLLEEALSPTGSFLQADLTAPDWKTDVERYLSNLQLATCNLQTGNFPTITAFAVLHHIPGVALRMQMLAQVSALLPPGGRFIHSNWQFLNSPRLAARVQPWDSVGLSADDLDPGDALLDWRSGGTGLRYVHHFDEVELHALATQAGFNVIETFYSDGATGNLGLYQVWQKPGGNSESL
jgi:SAM-dependent methyltransferase